MANEREQKQVAKMLAQLARPQDVDCEGGLMVREMLKENSGGYVAMGVPPAWIEYFVPMQTCAMCGKLGGCAGEEKMLCCGVCKVTHYCSRPCQKKDWAEHKNTCGMYCDKVQAAVEASKTVNKSKNEYVTGAAAFMKWKETLNTIMQYSLMLKEEELYEDWCTEGLKKIIKKKFEKFKYEEGIADLEEDGVETVFVARRNSIMLQNMKNFGAKGNTFLFFGGTNNDLSVAVFEREKLLETCKRLFKDSMKLFSQGCREHKSVARYYHHTLKSLENRANLGPSVVDKDLDMVMYGFALPFFPLTFFPVTNVCFQSE